jgi:hypothetical protein
MFKVYIYQVDPLSNTKRYTSIYMVQDNLMGNWKMPKNFLEVFFFLDAIKLFN